MVLAGFGLYSILTNPILGYEKLTEILVDEKVPFIQVRIKDKPRKTIVSIAANLRSITQNSISKLIINDDPALALESEADGVHLGQNDMSFDQARTLLGKDKLIGLSTHNEAQLLAAVSKKPDYIGIGPVYPTPTKLIPDPVLGVEEFGRLNKLSTVPAIAIGGITTKQQLDDLKDVGANNICVVRWINQSENPREVIALIRERFPF